MFSKLGSFLFHPVDSISRYVQSLRLRFQMDTKKAVGIHVRVLEKGTSHLWTEMNTYQLQKRQLEALAWSCSGLENATNTSALTETKRTSATDDNTVWFIASDNVDTLQVAQQKFGPKVVFSELTRSSTERKLRDVQVSEDELYLCLYLSHDSCHLPRVHTHIHTTTICTCFEISTRKHGLKCCYWAPVMKLLGPLGQHFLWSLPVWLSKIWLWLRRLTPFLGTRWVSMRISYFGNMKGKRREGQLVIWGDEADRTKWIVHKRREKEQSTKDVRVGQRT